MDVATRFETSAADTATGRVTRLGGEAAMVGNSEPEELEPMIADLGRVDLGTLAAGNRSMAGPAFA